MRKILNGVAWVVILCMLTAVMPAYAEGEDRVEISFCVGDDTLMINGEAVQVEKPYVVGVGVTLVPLRVITEAFGATVEWIAETETINLSYPDVKIVLQIGNPVAEVNGMAEQLLSAPELTENGFTVVPLRFISETFGAEVGYDEATERITVVKEKMSGTDVVEGTISNAYIGDSYYKWTMETPADMPMSDRDFNGMSTMFEYDENNSILLTIHNLPDDFEFSKEYAEALESLKGYTLVKAEKDASYTARKYMHFQVKDKATFLDIYQYITDKYIFIISGMFENGKTDVRDEGIRILSTFDCTYKANDVYDLSNVKDGVRRYESDSMKFVIDVPEDFYQLSSDDIENEIMFAKLDAEELSYINIGIYSKSDAGSAEKLAQKDYTHNKETTNKDLVKYSASVEQKHYANFDAYEYWAEINSTSLKQNRRDVFFELGEYVYNVHVALSKNEDISLIDKMLNSIEIGEIDASEVGILMRNTSDYEGTYTSSGSGWSMIVPNSYSEVKDDKGALFINRNNDISIVFTYAAVNDVTVSDVTDYLVDMEENLKKEPDVKIVRSPGISTVPIEGRTYREFIWSQEKDGERVYFRILATVYNGKIVMFTIAYPEMMYSIHNVNEVQEIVDSLNLD